MLKLLLLSNSTNYEQPYFEWPLPYVKDFLNASIQNIIFIPYAAVGFDYNEYEKKVNDAWVKIDKKVKGIHHFNDPIQAIKSADAIVVGGGNTWQLLKLIYENELLEPIKEKVKRGTPYIGWSAGSNLACPSIKTTNDMPIVQPPSFAALELIPFQINPHYTESSVPGHGGESRAQRIEEFGQLNDTYVIGLPEGSFIKVINNQVNLIGDKEAKLFHQKDEIKPIARESDLSFLLK